MFEFLDLTYFYIPTITSIGANVEEAIGAQSKKDFQHKLSIAYKEARETHYWIRLLRDSEFIGLDQATSLLDDCDELLKISGSIIVTLKKQRDSEEGSDCSAISGRPTS